ARRDADAPCRARHTCGPAGGRGYRPHRPDPGRLSGRGRPGPPRRPADPGTARKPNDSLAQGTRMTLTTTRRPLARGARLLLAGAFLGLAAGCAATDPVPPAPAAVTQAAPSWTFVAQGVDLVPGVFQSAYSPRTQRLYVASAVGRPPVRESRLLKVDPATLRIEAAVTPAPQASRQDGQ